MIDLMTLKQLRSQERANKSSLIELPPNFLEEVKELSDLAMKNENYSDFKDIIHYLRIINEIRVYKIIKFVIYRSTSARSNLMNLDNSRDDENDLYLALHELVLKHNENINSLFDGHYIPKTEKIGGVDGETKKS